MMSDKSMSTRLFGIPAALLTLAIFSLVTINLDRILQSIRGDIDVVVYLHDSIHPEDQARLHRDLAATSGVLFVLYVSREHVSRVPGLAEFLAEFTAAATSGPDGYLAERGFIPLEPEERAENDAVIRSLTAAAGTTRSTIQGRWMRWLRPRPGLSVSAWAFPISQIRMMMAALWTACGSASGRRSTARPMPRPRLRPGASTLKVRRPTNPSPGIPSCPISVARRLTVLPTGVGF